MNKIQPKPMYDKKTQKKGNSSNVIIAILSLLLLALAFFAYRNYQKNKESEASLLEEKLQIQSDLDAKIIALDNAIAENTSISSELLEAKKNILVFRDSVKNLKKLNFNIIRHYKDKLAVLERTNNRLLYTADSLKRANYALAIERDSAKAKVLEQEIKIADSHKKNDSLLNTNTELTQKIVKGSALRIGNIAVIAMKNGWGDKLKETTRARKTSAFRIKFIVRANSIATSGNRDAYIVIQDASGKVLSPKGSFHDMDEKEIFYSDTTTFEYNNDDLEVIILTKIDEDKLPKGDYYIKVYIEKRLLGTTSIHLK